MMDIGMTSLYEDIPTQIRTIMKPRKPSPSVNEMKRSMKLDLNSGEPQPVTKKMKVANTAMVLSSPDLHMLKLASPDLEKFLMTNLGVATTTPTPTQYFFPKNVSEEQEGFAKGFVAALTELRQQDNSEPDPAEFATVPSVGATAIITTTAGQTYQVRSLRNGFAVPPQNTAPQTTTVVKAEQNCEPRVLTVLNPVQVNSSTELTSDNTAFPPTTTMSSLSPTMLPQTLQSPPPHHAVMVNPNLIQIKEESEMVPSPATTSDSMRSSLCGTPPLSPIDMEMQEKVKVERKRARNRIAAMKCRQRKIERIQVLEERVSELKHTNQDLEMTAQKLKQEIAHLRDQIIQHHKAGCQILPPHHISSS